MKIAHWLLITLLLAIPARADVLNVRLIDPAHTDAGEAINRWLSAIPDVRVTKQDITQLRQSAAPADGVVVWLSPDPALYAPAARAAWDRVIANPKLGLLTLGVPSNEHDQSIMLASMRHRLSVSPDANVGIHLSGANWIWTTDPPKDHQTVFLRKAFDLDAMPNRAWINLAADNRATLFVNQHRVGEADSWKSPADFDVRSLLHVGQNVLEIKAYNEDGPAGVIGSLLMESAAPGSAPRLSRIVTDGSWAFATAANNGASQPAEFGDHAWSNARIVAKFGGGEWGESIDINYASDLRTLTATGASEIAHGLTGDLGRACVPCGLELEDGAAALLQAGDLCVAASADNSAGRSIFCTIDLDHTPDASGSLQNRLFADFIHRSVLWLARRPMNFQVNPVAANSAQPSLPPIDRTRFFPVTMQLSPIPYEGVPPTRNLPASPGGLHRLIDDFIAHGITLLQVPLPLPPLLARDVEAYAQSRGMGMTYYFEKSQTGFKRDKPPTPSLRSDAYRKQLAERLHHALQPLKDDPNLYNVFAMQDEPFHAGVESFSFSDADKSAFRKQFGYAMPTDPNIARNNPRQWLDLVNFQSDSFQIAWREMYRDMKRIDPTAQFVMNHDSHNVFGGAAGQEGKLFVDDVFHWGGDFADVLSFDIYPYLMKDFRYGPNRALKQPRMAQTHYALAQMREVTEQYGKKMGFFFGTYNPEWFDLTPQGRKQFWQSREMIDTAVAAGADELYAGLNVPIDDRHWDDLGDALRTLQKAAPDLLKTHPPRAAAAMLFPRTQCIQLQQEYWNVAESFELFQRAFGELDMLHEEDIHQLGKYRVLLLFDVKLLPEKVVDRIRQFVEDGGIVIADCVPNEDELRRPSDAMAKLFGVKDAETGRILWPAKMKAEIETDAARPATMPAATRPTDAVAGDALGVHVDFPIVSPRTCVAVNANVLLQSQNQSPAILTRTIGKGCVYLLGFCVQDTAFEAWRTGRVATIDQIGQLFGAMTHEIRPHIRSSNLAVEAAVRTGANQAFIFIISHEAADGQAQISVGNLPFIAARLIDVASGAPIEFTRNQGTIAFNVNAPNGTSQVLQLMP